MNLAEYWKEKTNLVNEAFSGWSKKEEIQIRKLIVAKVMDIPENHISYYLERDDWFLDFTLNDNTAINHSFAEERNIKEKVQSVIEVYFYNKDYKELCRIKGNETHEEPISKKMICDCIKELVEQKVYATLSKNDKELVDTFEKIYFEPFELFNEYIKEAAGAEAYYTLLVEQWKTANEMAANISEQRNNMNNFYMSLMSILIGGILVSSPFTDSNIIVKTILYAAIWVIGTVCCQKWIAQIENYGKLNAAKYDLINKLERNLPANVLLCEYMKTEQNARRNQNKINFSQQEKEIAQLFRVIVILVPLTMLISTWVEYLWKII